MVSWPLASTAIVVAAVALMLVWYERTRPSSRTVALVAAMAALAVVGRIAFAPIPNVKPTTDLVLLAGLAFGVVPGFAVGATAALVSNIVFGQGLHTPWQMLAWGGVGVLGALVGRALGPQPGRWPLAAICALAGVAFGAFMDLSIWATVGGQHTLAEYWVISLRSVPFNIAHAVGNLVFALAFAPALLGALARAAARSEVVVRPLPRPVVQCAAVALLGLVLAVASAGAPSSAQAATQPIDYLLTHQHADGGFGTGSSSSELESGWAAMAVGATPGVSAKVRSRAAGYLRRAARSLTEPGDLERTILALRALGAPAKDDKGRDLTAALAGLQQPDGSFGGLVNLTSFGVLALRASGKPASSPAVRKAVAFLIAHPGSDGGFTYSGRGPGGIDDTAGAVQALVAGGRKGSKVTKAAVAFLRGKQSPDGGFGMDANGRSNAQSTSWATQAFVAVGVRPSSLKQGGNTPLSFLKSLRVSDGHIRYSRSTDQTPVWVTANAQLALVGSPLPVRPAAAAKHSSAATSAHRTRVERRKARRARHLRRVHRRERQAKRFSHQILIPTASSVLLLSVALQA